MDIDKKVLDQMLDCAFDCLKNDEIPVSAAILDKNNNLVCICGNDRQNESNVLNHAEINAIVKAESLLGDWRLNGYYMISSLEPCDMCSAVIEESRIDNVFYFLPRKNASKYNIFSSNKYEIIGYDDYKKKYKELLTSFFDKKRR